MFILIAALLSGCAGDKISSDRITVVTTLLPLYEFAAKIGGDRADVSLLLPPGAEPHTFEPKPSDAVRISKADVFIYTGAGMEPWAEDMLLGLNNPSLSVLDASTAVTLLKAEDHGHEGEHEHSHEDERAFEWAAVFELDAGEYIWSFAKVNGEYAEPSMKMIILETQTPDASGIQLAENRAKELMHSSNKGIKEHGSALIPMDIAYQLNFAPNLPVSSFTIKIDKKGHYVFFTEYMPLEFEADEHFFKDSHGNNMEPSAEEPESRHDHDEMHEKENIQIYDEMHKHAENRSAGHHHGEFDPHIWLDFTNDMKIADAIAEVFSQKDPEGREYYFANAKAYKAKLEKLDSDYIQALSNCRTKEFITGGHNAYAYLAKRYGLSFISAHGISPDSEPTPQTLAEIIKITREHGLKHVMFEELVSPRLAEAISEQTGAKTILFNPGHNLGKDDFGNGVTFISLMEQNLESLKTALDCR